MENESIKQSLDREEAYDRLGLLFFLFSIAEKNDGIFSAKLAGENLLANPLILEKKNIFPRKRQRLLFCLTDTVICLSLI